MSWQDKDTLDLQITTGDGKVYTVLWLAASQKTKWHASASTYIDRPDTKVTKRLREGRVFPLEFFFQGDNHLEDSAAFRASLDDLNPCTIEHPYYNTIIAQIIELDIDNGASSGGKNLSRCTCTAIETIVGESASIDDTIDVVLLKKVELDDMIQEQEVTGLTVTEINITQTTAAKVNKVGADRKSVV